MRVRVEADLESQVVTWSMANGILTLKFTPIGQRGWPDRLFFGDHGRLALVELKRPGEKPEPLQLIRIKELNVRGIPATWSSDFHHCIDFLHRELLA